MTAKIIQFAERSPKKINQKYFDEFFEQLKAGVSCGSTEGRADEHKSDGQGEDKGSTNRANDSEVCVRLLGENCDSRQSFQQLPNPKHYQLQVPTSGYQAPPAGMGYVGEDGGFVPEFADSVVQDAPSHAGDGAHSNQSTALAGCAPNLDERLRAYQMQNRHDDTE